MVVVGVWGTQHFVAFKNRIVHPIWGDAVVVMVEGRADEVKHRLFALLSLTVM